MFMIRACGGLMTGPLYVAKPSPWDAPVGSSRKADIGGNLGYMNRHRPPGHVPTRHRIAGVIAAMSILVSATTPSVLSGQATCGRVSIGSHALFACRSGSGEPTVVLEAGMRNDHQTWRAVVPLLASLTTVITYDRAGLGESDEGPLPRTSRQITDELRALLQAMEAASPYVLVGHSIGGRHVRTFASRYPSEAAALVLLDSPHERFEADRLELLTPTERDDRLASLRANRATLPLSVQHEYAGIEQSAPPARLPPVPVVVVAAGRHRWEPATSADGHERLWQAGQRLLRDSNPFGELYLLADAGHNLHLERPDTVAAIVMAVIRRVREK